MLPEPAAKVVDRYLARVESAAPGLIEGFYVVGSVALEGFRPGRSDIDFAAILARPCSISELAALRRVHRRCFAGGVSRAAASRSWPLVCNGFFLAARADLGRPPADVVPVAAQVAEKFVPTARFDVNPVTWWTLAHHGLAVRGPEVKDLSVRVDDVELRRWTAANLVAYWRPWADAIIGTGPGTWASYRHLWIRRLAASGVLGTARMHATITTGRVITKEAAGEHALAVFDERWHPIIHDALAYWRGLPPHPGRSRSTLRRETAGFVLQVTDLVGATPPNGANRVS